MNFFCKHIGDWIKDTAELSLIEDGAYNRLIDQYYQSERPLPLDRNLIYRMARAMSQAERKACDAVLSRFFIETPQGYVQKRAATEIARYQDKQRKAQASANVRWGKSVSDANGYANASPPHNASDMRTQCEGNASQYPVTSNQEKPKGAKHVSGYARAGELCAAMRRNSIEAQAGDPRVTAAADAGVTVATIEAACVEAHGSKPGERVPAGYVLSIAERWTREASQSAVDPSVRARASPPRPPTKGEVQEATIAGLTGRGRSHDDLGSNGVVDVSATRIA